MYDLKLFFTEVVNGSNESFSSDIPKTTAEILESWPTANFEQVEKLSNTKQTTEQTSIVLTSNQSQNFLQNVNSTAFNVNTLSEFSKLAQFQNTTTPKIGLKEMSKTKNLLDEEKTPKSRSKNNYSTLYISSQIDYEHILSTTVDTTDSQFTTNLVQNETNTTTQNIKR